MQTQQANQTRPENPNSPAHPSPAWAQPFLRTGPLPQCLQPGPAYARGPSLRKPAPCAPLSHGPLSPCRLSPSLPGRTHRSGSSPSPCWPPLFRSRRAPSLLVALLRPVRAPEAHWPASQGLSPSRSFLPGPRITRIRWARSVSSAAGSHGRDLRTEHARLESRPASFNWPREPSLHLTFPCLRAQSPVPSPSPCPRDLHAGESLRRHNSSSSVITGPL